MHDIAYTRKRHIQNRTRLYGERYHDIKTCQSGQHKQAIFFYFFMYYCIFFSNNHYRDQICLWVKMQVFF
jgi:hypothetical protein